MRLYSYKIITLFQVRELVKMWYETNRKKDATREKMVEVLLGLSCVQIAERVEEECE